MTNVLSPRELDILRLLANGVTVNDIATQLQVTRHTVAEHRLRIADKLERDGVIHSRTLASLIRYAMVSGLVTGTI